MLLAGGDVFSLSTVTAKYWNFFTGKVNNTHTRVCKPFSSSSFTPQSKIFDLLPTLFPLVYFLLVEMGGKRGATKSRIKPFSPFFNFPRSKTQLAGVGFLLFLPLRCVSFWPLPPGAPLAPRFKDDSATVANASPQRRFRILPGCTTATTRPVTNSGSVTDVGRDPLPRRERSDGGKDQRGISMSLLPLFTSA